MDTCLYDSPLKAFMKWIFLLITYFGSICFKSFSISLVLPTVFIYFASNIYDYADLAFVRKDKTATIKNYSLGIFVYLVLCAVLSFTVCHTENTSIQDFVNRYYFIIYICCAIVWVVPFIDGIKSQTDKNRREAIAVEEKMKSSYAYSIMENAIIGSVRE